MWTRPAAIFSSVVEAPPGGIGNYFGSNAGVVYAFDTGGAYDISGPPSLVATKDLSATTTDVTGPMTFASDGTQLYLANTNLGTTFPNQNIIQFTLSTPWDITTAAYASKAKSYRAEFGTKGIRGMVFKPDGTVVYLSGPSDPNGLDWVQSYTLGTAWDVSTATVSTGKQIFDVNVNLTLIRFKPDGTKMYAVDAGPGGTTSIRTIRQYSLSTAWNISTLTFLSSYQVSDTTGTTTADIINGLDFSPDGTVMFVTAFHAGGAKLYQFSLSTAWDVTTATYTGISFESPTSAGSQGYVFFEQTTTTGGGGVGADGFLDNFTGTGTLATHNPDIGGAYTAHSGVLTNIHLDGAGHLDYNPVAQDAYAQSAITLTGDTYVLEASVTLTAVSSSFSADSGAGFDVAVVDTVSGNWLVEIYISWQAAPPTNVPYQVWVVNSSGSTLFTTSQNIYPSISVGVPFIVRAEVSPSGVVFKLNGTTLFTTAQKPDILPNAILFDAVTVNGATDGYVDYVSVTEGSGTGTIVYDSFTGTNGTLISAHTPEIGGAWIAGTTFDTSDGSSVISINSGVAGIDNTSGSHSLSCGVINAATIPSADYGIEAVFKQVDPPRGGRLHLLARVQDSSHYYILNVDLDFASTINVYLANSQTGFIGPTYVAPATDFTAGATVRWEIVGAVHSVYVNDVLRIQVTDPAPIAGPGSVGFAVEPANSTAYVDQVQSFRAYLL